MTSPQAAFAGLDFIEPNPSLHAPITLRWFRSESGKETLLLMGNAERETNTPTLESEIQILQGFVDLRKQNKQLTWMIQFDHEVIGVAWIELTENHGVKAPSVHLMIGDKNYRGKGIGKATMTALIHYIKEHIEASTIYSRHLKSNVVVANMNQSLGFANDGDSYIDGNRLEWQNVTLVV